MRAIPLREIRNTSDLAKYLYCSEIKLEEILSSKSSIRYYKKMNIPKKNRKIGGYRTVYKANDLAWSSVHKHLETAINISSNFPSYVQGFVRERSIVTNAKRHLAKKLVLNADIKNFFESISFDKVINVFKHLGANDAIAEALSKICTIDGLLAEGLSTSPVIANIASRDMDKDLFELSKLYDCEFTRYADDITFSGDESIPTKNEIEDILERYGFQLNYKKYKMQKRCQHQFVTGLTVFDEKHPRLPKHIKKNIRLTLYFANKYGLKNHLEKVGIEEDFFQLEINRIDGLIGFMFCVEPKLAKKLKELWTDILYKYSRESGIGDGSIYYDY